MMRGTQDPDLAIISIENVTESPPLSVGWSQSIITISSSSTYDIKFKVVVGAARPLGTIAAQMAKGFVHRTPLPKSFQGTILN